MEVWEYLRNMKSSEWQYGKRTFPPDMPIKKGRIAKMNPDTGEIKSFEGEIPVGWVQLRVGERVYIKGCHFVVQEVKPGENLIILKGVSKDKKDPNELEERKRYIVQPGAFGKHHKVGD